MKSLWGKRLLKPKMIEEMELIIENENLIAIKKSIIEDDAPVNACLNEANIE